MDATCMDQNLNKNTNHQENVKYYANIKQFQQNYGK